MFIATAGALVHVGWDYLFIYPVGWGVQGAAWATVVGQGSVAVVFLIVLSKRFIEARWRFDPHVMRSLMSVGADLVVRSGALVGALTLATAVAARMGVVALGAWQVTMQMYSFLAFAQDSIAIAAQPMIGRLLGAEEPDEAKTVARRLLVWGVSFGVVLGIVVFVFRRPIAGVFTNDPAVVLAAAGLLGWLAVIQPLSATAFTLDGILIGASDTRVLAVSMLGSSALFVSTALLALQYGWRTAGLAAGVTIWLAARSATLGRRLIGGRWAGKP
jgi:MATE family, multidrug efflux pump